MEIRKCREEEIVPTGAFYDSTVKWLDAHINYPKWQYREYPSENSVRRMAGSDSQYICLEDGKIIGAFGLNDQPQGAYRKGKWKRDLPEGSYLVIHSLGIDPGMHRQGVGAEILHFCIEKARSEGFQAIRVDIVPDNRPARKLFEKHGFTYAGDADLELGVEGIPFFSLYELDLS